MKRILFICMGNICRSAMAEGILRHKIQLYDLPLSVDSAGTHGYHQGELYDVRAREILKAHGIDVDDLHSRRVCKEDFENFDIILAADHCNLRMLREEFGDQVDKVGLMTRFSYQYRDQDIPDPYYGGPEGFSKVYSMLDESIDAWLISEGLC